MHILKHGIKCAKYIREMSLKIGDWANRKEEKIGEGGV